MVTTTEDIVTTTVYPAESVTTTKDTMTTAEDIVTTTVYPPTQYASLEYGHNMAHTPPQPLVFANTTLHI